MQAIALDEENFPVLQSPARPKQASFLHKILPEKAAEGLHERPRSPVSTLNQAPSATPSPAPHSAADLHSGHVTPIKATATSTCSDTGTDASAPHQAPPAAASTCSEGEEAHAAPAPERVCEVHPDDGESQDDSTSSGKTTAADGAAAGEPAAAAAEDGSASQPGAEPGETAGIDTCQSCWHLALLCEEQDWYAALNAGRLAVGHRRGHRHRVSCRRCRAKGGGSSEAPGAGRGACRVRMGPQQQAAL